MEEKCAVFAVYSPTLDVARLTYFGLMALQHRGQEGSGIVTTNGETFFAKTGSGLVAQVFSDEALDALSGFAAIGHNRYSTSGNKHESHPQPVLRTDDVLALAHNGNLPDVSALKSFLKAKHVYKQGSNDSEMMTDALRYFHYRGHRVGTSIKKAWPLFRGAFSCVVLDHETIYAFRDSHGIRPLSIGRINKDSYVVTSETAALDLVGATHVRDIRPGELITINTKGIKSTQIAPGHERLDVFEYIYFARPDSQLQGQSVNTVRHRLGCELAREHPVKADIVVGVPDSGVPAGLGFAQCSGIPFDIGLIKNRYIHRTFITPTQEMRERRIKMKLNPLKEILANKSVVLVDDSLVRGTTTKQIVAMVRAAGAKEVHVRISSPPVLFPDFYGIDTPTRGELIGANHSVEEITKVIGADSLGYLSIDGLVRAIGKPADSLCLACFNGDYPIDIGAQNRETVFGFIPETEPELTHVLSTSSRVL